MIQIFGRKTDPHVKSVTNILDSNGLFFHVFDIFDPKSDGIQANICNGADIEFCEATAHPMPSVVWWRQKPPFLVESSSAVDYYDQQFAFREWLPALDYLSMLYEDSRWVNRRSANTLASNKIHQLSVAVHVGFKIPRTLFSNNAQAVMKFVSSFDGTHYIHKTIMPYVAPDRRQKYTSLIDKNLIESNFNELEVCPGIFQQHIDPKFELRITVIGNEFFATKILKKNRSEPDWRREIFDDIYEPFDLDESFKRKLQELNEAFGLTYGAYDFIVDKNGDIFFIEVNPTGQWLWIEEKIGLPISRAVAKLLSK
ncbi:hypothetical protein [Burkholderia pseudomallei]|uniref:hypothetical protein n=1 Tax=Burkholderia pseudomallei TaxID=28450 RepID=UPI0012FE6736|nr:hypothetical protein [Burkholderia pseudomallei]